MENNFYNRKYTLITYKKVRHKLPGYIDNFYGSFNDSYLKIKSHEIENNEFYSGHFIVNNIKTDLDYDTFKLNELTRHNIYFDKVVHYPTETASNNIIFCSSWVLPFLYGIEHTPKSLYTQCFMHRLDILQLESKKSSLI